MSVGDGGGFRVRVGKRLGTKGNVGNESMGRGEAWE